MRKNQKIISFAKISSVSNFLKEKRTVLVGGCFDIFHYGHLQFLKKAKKQGDILIIALESDQFIKKRKKRMPFHNQKQRAKILSSLNFVDLVILLPYFSSDDDYFKLVNEIKPKVIAITAGDLQRQNKAKQAKMVGGKVVVVTPLIKNFSSTRIYKFYETFFSD